MAPEYFIAALFVICDITAYIMYGIDKLKAIRGSRRIPERTLLLSAVPGGIGALLGIFCFRHKTKKWYFRAVAILFSAAQVMILFRLLV